MLLCIYVDFRKRRPGLKGPLGERLVEAGLIDDIQLSVALGVQRETGLKIGKQLMKLGFIGEAELSEYLKDETDVGGPLIKRLITDKAVKSVPQDLAFKHKVMPVAFAGDTIVLATSNPSDIAMLDELSFRLGKKIHPVMALEWDIESALLKYYKFFSDEEIEMLSSASNIAEQYKSASWSFKDELTVEPTSLAGKDKASVKTRPAPDRMELEPTSYSEAESIARAKAGAKKPKPAPAPAIKQVKKRPAPARAPSTAAAPHKVEAKKPKPAPAPATKRVKERPAPAGAKQSSAPDSDQKKDILIQALIEILVDKDVFSENELRSKLLNVKRNISDNK
jgi:type IV pilus assembly protein PilB